VIRFLTQPSRATDRPIRVNPDICWVRWQSRSTDQRNGRKIIVICFEFGSGMRDSHHPECKVSECGVMRDISSALQGWDFQNGFQSHQPAKDEGH